MAGPLGVLGGIFDPIHNGHLAIASLAREYFKLHQVLFIPSGNPPHKESTVVASAQDRLAMLQIALQDEPGVAIYDCELKRSGFSFTIDTIHELQSRFNTDIYFIIGSDNIREIKTWHRYQEILKLVTLCIAHRPGYACTVGNTFAEATIRQFPSPEWGISSTMIRSYIGRGFSCRHLLPSGVIDYITTKGLYRSSLSARSSKEPVCRR